MTSQTLNREIKRLREIAREYQQRGYDVLIAPRPDQLPDFLASFQIDILARSHEEQVIIEVRTQESLTDAPELDAIAAALQDKPSWRFELVVTNPSDRLSSQFTEAISLSQTDIVYRLLEARQLSDQEHGEAAFLLAWSATEALMRSIAQLEAVPVTQHDPGQVAKSLLIYGILDKEQYHILQAGLHARTMIVHGFKHTRLGSDQVQQLLGIAEQLQKQYLNTV